MISTSLLTLLTLSTLATSSPTPGNPTYNSGPSIPDSQHLSLNFTSRSLPGSISVLVQPNTDNTTAFGLDLIYPSYPDLFANFHGFPVIHGEITYPLPAAASGPGSGYASLFGWIQFIQAGAGTNWTVDSYPYAADLGDPFGGWGYLPRHFDAPAYTLDEDVPGELAWRAMTFLCVLGNAGVTKNVSVLPGGAFTWGFDMSVSADNSSRSISLMELTTLDVASGWAVAEPILTANYEEWTFQNYTG